ncbi:MAG: DUF2189 domain-containing protein [Burkholderiaceae bacterium]|nr:DUF2189 domain-containing protein [Burkholderiaceae bacterium]
MPPNPLVLPTVRTIGLLQSFTWLVLAWRDITRAGWISVAHGLALTLFGAAIFAVGHHRFWLLAGAFSGFMVVAPVLATSMYALSRALERGEPANRAVVLKTWLNWQDSHVNKWGNDYWCMVQFGALLALAATGWVVTSAALITLLAPVPIATPLDFLRHVVMAPEGWLFELWLALGSLMAAPIFASSVVAMPLLLDRRATLRQAVLASWQTVLCNPLPMALWAALILGLTLVGMGTLLLGLILVMPLLGHASWHAYRDLIDVSALPERNAGIAAHSAGGTS